MRMTDKKPSSISSVHCYQVIHTTVEMWLCHHQRRKSNEDQEKQYGSLNMSIQTQRPNNSIPDNPLKDIVLVQVYDYGIRERSRQ